MAIGIRQTIVMFGMPVTTPGLHMKEPRGLARVMKDSSFMRVIGRATTVGMTMIIAGIGTSGTGTITGTTTVMGTAKVTGDRAPLAHVRWTDHIWPNDQVWSARLDPSNAPLRELALSPPYPG
jgi:hypothetical protein